MLRIMLYDTIFVQMYLLCFVIVSETRLSAQENTKFIISGISTSQRLKFLHHFQLFQFEDYYHTRKKHQPTSENKNDQDVHPSSIYYALKFENYSYAIDLELNHKLLSDDFSIFIHNMAGNKRKHKLNESPKNHCYYQGYVRGIDNSRVVASACQGLRGTVMLPNDIFFIEPLQNGSHVMYHVYNDTGNVQHLMCLKSNSVHNDSYLQKNTVKRRVEIGDELLQQRPIKRKYLEPNNDRKYIELMVIVSYEVYKKFSNISSIESFVKETVNYVDSFYQGLNIDVILTEVEVWNKKNIVNMTTADQFLLDIGSYRLKQMQSQPPSSSWRQADAIQLLFSDAFKNGVFGNAYSGTMCTTKALGVTRLNNYAINTASTMAHEIGHNFGMAHDSESCTCNAVECFMAARTRFRHPMQWSSCSQQALKHCFEVGLGNCLYNIPKIIHGGPICGNNIVEHGEQCDCGFPKHCESKCCNSTSCQLVSGAKCDDSLLCCDDCQIAAVGHQCRGIANECDLPEVCNGADPKCPANAYKEDGSRCSDGKAICKEGVCLTVDLLCESMWGVGSKGPSYCYEELNVLGEYIGNCGRDKNGNYIPCSPEDVFCGKLFCDGGQKEPVVNDYAEITITHIGYHVCKSYVFQKSNLSNFELGLVPNGASCGFGKACQDRTCQSVPSSVCKKECNGNEICNNFGECQCINGWKSPYCNETDDFTTRLNLNVTIKTDSAIDYSFNCSQQCSENELCDEYGRCSCKAGLLPPLCTHPEKQREVDLDEKIANKTYFHFDVFGSFYGILSNWFVISADSFQISSSTER